MTLTPNELFTGFTSFVVFLSALFLGLIAKALSPDFKAFPCVDKPMRMIMAGTSLLWFIRASVIATSIGTPAARTGHWDVLFSWLSTFFLVSYTFARIMKLKQPPGVYEALEARDREKLRKIRELNRHGRPGRALAKLVAAGFEVAMPGAPPEGGSRSAAFRRKLRAYLTAEPEQ